MKKNLSFIIFAVIVLAFLIVLSFNKKVPLVPANALHINARTNEACAECHGPGKKAPLKSNHPPKSECLVCHKTK